MQHRESGTFILVDPGARGRLRIGQRALRPSGKQIAIRRGAYSKRGLAVSNQPFARVGDGLAGGAFLHGVLNSPDGTTR